MDSLMYAFGMLANAMGGGGDEGQTFPESDANDFKNGARHIPTDVTLARRRGEKVIFDSVKHEWRMPNGDIIK